MKLKINPEWKNARYEIAELSNGKKRKMTGYRFREDQLDELMKCLKTNPAHLYRIAIQKYL